MSKKETIHNGYELTIYRTVKKERISDKTEFTVSNCNNNPEVHDEMVFMNPDLIDLGRSIWHSAFEYVNQKLRQR